MKRDPVVIIVVALVVTVMIVFGFQVARRNSGQTASAGSNMNGQAAPDFTLEALDGKTVHLSDFRGKGVLLNFWATWCQPCKIEMPWFAELQKQYGPQGLQIVGIAMDDASPKEIGEFAHDLGVKPSGPMADAFDRLRPYGFLILYGLMLTGMLTTIVSPVASFLFSWLL